MSKLNLEIISPTGVVFKGECQMAVVPSAAGEIGVMYGHESVIASLKDGCIAIYDEKENLIKTKNPDWTFLNPVFCIHWPPKEKPSRF